MVAMNERDILVNALKARGISQKELAEAFETTQGALSEKINRKRMSFRTFRDILDSLGYDIVIVDRETGEQVWSIEVDEI